MQTRINTDIFKSYDIRGIYPSELNEDVAESIGRAFVQFLNAKTIAIGRDMRTSSQALCEAFARGVMLQGADVVDLGLTSTDELYFAVGHYGYPAGAMITASHNPKEYNGLKLCRENAIALSAETGVFAIRDLVAAGAFQDAARAGTMTRRNALPDFVKHCLSFIDISVLKPLRIVIDCGNGMGGLIVPAVFEKLPLQVIPLHFELDGTFPNHPASPIEPENMVDVQKAVKLHGADLGAAFDGDADRMFITDEQGRLVGGDMVTALVADMLLRKHPHATILYNLICSRAVPELIAAHGGKAVRTRVGHSIIKSVMREQNAIFGGEHSGHFYFRDNYFADSGLIALLVVLELISREGRSVSKLLQPLDRRCRSGEINSRVDDIPAKLRELERHYAGARSIDRLDGVTFEFEDWWFNVRPSNTEPLLRLNVEADSAELLARKRDEVLSLIRT